MLQTTICASKSKSSLPFCVYVPSLHGAYFRLKTLTFRYVSNIQIMSIGTLETFGVGLRKSSGLRFLL
eukprot:UN16530